MNEVVVMATIVVVGVGTFLMRLSFMPLAEQTDKIPLLRRALRFVPAALLPAIVMPALLSRDGALDLSLGNARLLAGLVAIVVARLSRNTLLTLASGMLTLWLLQAVGLVGPN